MLAAAPIETTNSANITSRDIRILLSLTSMDFWVRSIVAIMLPPDPRRVHSGCFSLVLKAG